MKRYKITKEQLERVVENFVMEAAENNGKAPVKNHIPTQGAEAKKHVKHKISGDMVEKSEGLVDATPMKKKLSQAPEAKKFMSKKSATHSTKTGMMKEGVINENIAVDIYNALGGDNIISVGGESVKQGVANLALIGTLLGAGAMFAAHVGKDVLKNVFSKNKDKVAKKADEVSMKVMGKKASELTSEEKDELASQLANIADKND